MPKILAILKKMVADILWQSPVRSILSIFHQFNPIFSNAFVKKTFFERNNNGVKALQQQKTKYIRSLAARRYINQFDAS
jgi:hypothetical protein